MKLEEVPESSRYEYILTCPLCDLEHVILSQDDGEYRTKIYLECQCGEFIEFILPIN